MCRSADSRSTLPYKHIVRSDFIVPQTCSSPGHQLQSVMVSKAFAFYAVVTEKLVPTCKNLNRCPEQSSWKVLSCLAAS